MTLRETIDTVLANEPLDRVSMERGALLALESLPCECFTPVAHAELVACERCIALASLASEGKGG
jgi:hypothetical protein